MEMKSTAPYPPPPPPPPLYSSIRHYPEPQPSSHGYPHPATSGTPYYPVPPPTADIGFRQVYVHNQEPSPVIVVHKYRNKRCCLSSVVSLLFTIIIIIVLLKVILRIW